MKKDNDPQRQLEDIRLFYDSIYHKSAKPVTQVSSHLRRLASRLDIRKSNHVLDVACGVGEWLQACTGRGATPFGVDLSQNAIAACKKNFTNGEFHTSPAETLPFDNGRFDVISCLGSLEHFVDQEKALAEMMRVSKDGAKFLFLVPNADFLTRKFGLFRGTYQIDAKEDVKSIAEWTSLFENAGLVVNDAWRDLHVISWRWISAGRWYLIPLRTMQALMLAIWPLRWQYQIYFLCRKR